MMDKASMDKKLERIRNVIRACNKLKLKLKQWGAISLVYHVDSGIFSFLRL